MNKLRKIIIPILIIAMFFCIIPKTENAAENKLKIGDINGDGAIDSRDTLRILEHIAASNITKIRQNHSDWILTGEKYKVGDINGDGTIDSIDTLRILEYIAASTIPKIEQKHPDWKTYIESKWTIEVTGITLNSTSITIKKGSQSKLVATITPTNATDKTIIWSSSDTKVVIVDGLGNVEGKSVGIAIITAKTSNGKTASAQVKVTEPTTPVETPTKTPTPTTPTQTTPTETPTKTPTQTTPTETPTKTPTQTTPTKPTIPVITKKDISKVSLTLSKTSVSYNGKAQTPAVTLKDGNKTLKNGADYTLAYSNNKNVGTATITITGKGTYTGKVTKQFKITEVKATKIALKQIDRTIAVGTTLQLNATITPANTTNKTITWSSSDNKIAKVSSLGVVSGIKPGKVTITAKTSNNKIATCIIRVNIPAKSISLNKAFITINKGSTEKLIVSFNPTNTSSKEINWISSNSNVVSVSSTKTTNGSVTISAKSKGTATITATSKNGKTATCKILVTEISNIDNEKITVNRKVMTKAQYANFRNVCTGNIAPGVLYRCINPILPYSSKENDRAYYADRLLEAHQINTVLNLSDTLEKMKSKGYSKATYYKKLLNSGKVYSYKFVDDGKFGTTEKKKIIVNVLRGIIKNEGPYVIHCKWGQGRTGFIIMLLECLMNSKYEYMYNDFKASFNNLDHSGANKEFSKYMNAITGKSAADSNKPKASDWKNINFVKCAENYLKAGGMSNTEITALKNRLAGK